MALYDTIGTAYARLRRPDPRWAARIREAIGDARTVVNIGAGAGSYEPGDVRLVAVEPSETMIAQRPPGAAPAVRGVAEALPFADDSFDVALAILTVHHWTDAEAGLAEMQRVARRQVVVTWDPAVYARAFWFVRDYLQEADPFGHDERSAPFVATRLRATDVRALPVPHDCTDGFFAAYWRRPGAYLDPVVRGAISGLALRPAATLEHVLARLRDDLASGAWARRNAGILGIEELDAGYRVVIGAR